MNASKNTEKKLMLNKNDCTIVAVQSEHDYTETHRVNIYLTA